MRFASVILAVMMPELTDCGSSRAAQGPTPVTIAALPAAKTAGVGARLTFTEYEAENGATNGIVIGPDRRFTEIAAEASGRRAVRLVRQGDFVEFILARPANAISVRAAIPDGADGKGQDAALDLTVDGKAAGQVAVTSRYGWFYGRYPFTNHPGDGAGHHFFDETRSLLSKTFPAGTHVRLSVPSRSRAAWYVIDLADFAKVPAPLKAPANAVSLVTMGGDPTGTRSSQEALDRAIVTARARAVPVWIPRGVYRVDGHVTVDQVTIQGAGPWYSIVHGTAPGFYGKHAPIGSHDVRLLDFAIIGEITERKDDDQVNGIGGAMNDSTISNLFIQHTKVGLWFDGPMQGIRIDRVHVVDTAADGLNFHRGVRNAEVRDSFFRNTGDDGLAAWSGEADDHAIRFVHNTVINPILANGIAVYGGSGIDVRDNLIADTLTEGGGLHVGNRFKAVPLSGRIVLSGNVVVRGGSFDPRWKNGVGALWFYALDAPIAADIAVINNRLIDSSEQAVGLRGKSISGVAFDRLTIAGAKGAAIVVRSSGSASLSNSSATGIGAAAITYCGNSFQLLQDANNTGFESVAHSCVLQ